MFETFKIQIIWIKCSTEVAERDFKTWGRRSRHERNGTNRWQTVELLIRPECVFGVIGALNIFQARFLDEKKISQGHRQIGRHSKLLAFWTLGKAGDSPAGSWTWRGSSGVANWSVSDLCATHADMHWGRAIARHRLHYATAWGYRHAWPPD